jgi:hypothetical protein
MRKTATRQSGLASDDRRWKAELSDPDLVKKKGSRRPNPRGVEREPDSALARLTSLAEVAGSRHASGRSPDLVSQKRKLHASLPPAAFPILISGVFADGFESITVAGPRGNLTRFPILPDSIGAPEAPKKS